MRRLRGRRAARRRRRLSQAVAALAQGRLLYQAMRLPRQGTAGAVLHHAPVRHYARLLARVPRQLSCSLPPGAPPPDPRTAAGRCQSPQTLFPRFLRQPFFLSVRWGLPCRPWGRPKATEKGIETRRWSTREDLVTEMIPVNTLLFGAAVSNFSLVEDKFLFLRGDGGRSNRRCVAAEISSIPFPSSVFTLDSNHFRRKPRPRLSSFFSFSSHFGTSSTRLSW